MFVLIAIALAAAVPDLERTPRCDLPCKIWLVNFGSLAAPGLGLGVRAVAGDSLKNLEGTLVGLGAGTYLLGAPIVYWSRDLRERAIGSLGLRLGCPAVASFLGIAIGKAVGKTGDTAIVGAVQGGLFGAAAGALAAMILDAAWLARREAPPVLEPPEMVAEPASERPLIPGGHVYVGAEAGMGLTGPLPAGWSGGGAGAIVAIHAQVEGAHALAAITVVKGRAGSTCKPIPYEPFPQCQHEAIDALDFKLGYAFGERSWAPYIAVGPSYLSLTHSVSGDASTGFAVVGEGGVLLFRAQRWGRAALAATARVPLFSSDYGSPAFTLVTLGLRLML